MRSSRVIRAARSSSSVLVALVAACAAQQPADPVDEELGTASTQGAEDHAVVAESPFAISESVAALLPMANRVAPREDVTLEDIYRDIRAAVEHVGKMCGVPFSYQGTTSSAQVQDDGLLLVTFSEARPSVPWAEFGYFVEPVHFGDAGARELDIVLHAGPWHVSGKPAGWTGSTPDFRQRISHDLALALGCHNELVGRLAACLDGCPGLD